MDKKVENFIENIFKADVKMARSREETDKILQEQCTRKLYVTGINPKITKSKKSKKLKFFLKKFWRIILLDMEKLRVLK